MYFFNLMTFLTMEFMYFLKCDDIFTNKGMNIFFLFLSLSIKNSLHTATVCLRRVWRGRFNSFVTFTHTKITKCSINDN